MKCNLCGREYPEDQMLILCEDKCFCLECAKEELVECSRCGDILPRDCAEHTDRGWLCDICHGDLYD